MRIEKINENQIKCTLNRSDLASHQVKLSELAYGTEKAQSLFHEMMEQANLQFGFDAADLPLMIEAIPISMDCIILMVTKVEDPDAVDVVRSGLATLKYVSSDTNASASIDLDEQLEQLSKIIGLSGTAKKALADKKSESVSMFSFGSMEHVLALASKISELIKGDSALYKCQENGRYYLKISRGSADSQVYRHICSLAAEYGKQESLNGERSAYIDEHFDKILGSKAIESLAYV